MKYGTFASGIEACSVAWHGLGWKPQFFSEIAPFPCAVLKHHYPDVPNLGDMNTAQDNPIFQNAAVDLIFSGTPCQSFSIAGLRDGLNSPNGNLALQFLRLLEIKQPRWFGWENVPGVLTSWSDAEIDSQGRIWQTNDFETILQGFRKLGYGVAWRILDSQYFGVPQRRRRVFVIGYRGDWRRAAAVLYDKKSCSWIAQAHEKSLEGTTKRVVRRLDENSGGRYSIMESTAARATLLDDLCPTIKTTHEAPLLIFQSKATESQHMEVGPVAATITRSTANGVSVYGKVSPTITKGSHNAGPGLTPETAESLVKQNNWIRRITPLEVERLSGFPDNYTLIPGYSPKRKGVDIGTADGPRYAAIGNSKAIPVVKWLGERIQIVDSI